MDYAEFSEGDVYLQRTPEGSWICCGCKLAKNVVTELYNETFRVRDNQRFTILEDVEDHVYEHLDKGHQVPSRCLKLIEEELGQV